VESCSFTVLTLLVKTTFRIWCLYRYVVHGTNHYRLCRQVRLFSAALRRATRKEQLPHRCTWPPTLDTGTRFSFCWPSSGTWKCWTGGDAHPFIWPAMQVNNENLGFECQQLLSYFKYFSTLLYLLRCLLTKVETKCQFSWH
jgi:hypothetical protein